MTKRSLPSLRETAPELELEPAVAVLPVKPTFPSMTICAPEATKRAPPKPAPPPPLPELSPAPPPN
ncbi:MAG: hypothetical protein C0483_15290 [Pirellula sp.]|nr:hypothetical protein [Pirellula sp.]